MFLPFNEFVPRAPDHGVIRIEHGFGCEGSSRALKIERLDNGDIKARCYRCGKYGLKSAEFKFRPKNNEIAPNKENKFVLPDYFVSNPLYFSQEALEWLNQYRIFEEEIYDNKILFDPITNRIVFTVYRDKELVAYQLRRLIDDPKIPRYDTRIKYPGKYYGYFIHKQMNKIALVEDVLSAIKCARVLGMSSYAQLGGTISLIDKLELLTLYEEFFIFLDNDSRQIKMYQVELHHFFMSRNKKVHLIKKDRDPKCLTTNELNSIFGVNYVI